MEYQSHKGPRPDRRGWSASARIIAEHEDSGKFAKLLKKGHVEAAIVASGKELKDARKRVREVLKLPKKEQLKGLKGLTLQCRQSSACGIVPPEGGWSGP